MTYTSTIPRMDPEIKANWVAELRSGKRTQGYGYLNERGNECCLGVLCDISPVEGKNITGIIHAPNRKSWDGNITTLPVSVRAWAWHGEPYSIADNPVIFNADWVTPDNTMHSMRGWSLAELNDQRLTFAQIADVIDYFL